MRLPPAGILSGAAPSRRDAFWSWWLVEAFHAIVIGAAVVVAVVLVLLFNNRRR